MSRICLTLVALLGTAAAFGQSQIRWGTNPQNAVNEAANTGKPLLVYVLGATEDRDDKLESAQRRALADPEVLRMAQQFVPLKLSRTQHHKLLPDFGLGESANMEISFVAIDVDATGKRSPRQLSSLSPGGIAQVESLREKMKQVLEENARRLYQEQLQPILANPESKAPDVKRALAAVTQMPVAQAAPDVAALLDRPDLDKQTRVAAYGALAAISDEPAVKKLLELARGGDDQAARALEGGTIRAAEIVLSELDANAEPFDYVAYKAVAKIARLTNVKPARFFETAKPELKQKELERVQSVVQQQAARAGVKPNAPGLR
ncbi:MAG: hypothetical protein AB1716_00210 [Planctomycetota bacterium]